MAVPGREPSPEPNHRNPRVEWTEVEDVPYKGKRPTFPKERYITNAMGLQISIPMQPATHDWWDNVTTLPHCILWGPGEWQRAVTSAYVADAAHTGVAGAWSELRRREDEMGVTAEARRKLRIKTVPKGSLKATKTAAAKTTATAAGASVTNIDERRLRNRTA